MECISSLLFRPDNKDKNKPGELLKQLDGGDWDAGRRSGFATSAGRFIHPVCYDDEILWTDLLT